MSSKKYKLTALLATVCWLGLQGNVALAADQTTTDNQLVRKLAKRTQVLESRLQHLQSQVATLKRKQAKKNQTGSAELSGVDVVADPNHPVFIVGTPVISSPYIGINSEYNASDLVVNQPYVNEDLYLLQQRKQLYNYLHQQNNYPPITTPIVNLSGKIEAQVIHSDHFGNFQNGSVNDIDLTGIELDTEILVNEWTTGLIAFVYDNSPPSTSPRRIDNSNVFLERGFLTFGNLAKFPLYGTIGQFYVPFGQYSSGMISDPFTKTLGRTKARAIALGFSKQLNSENNLNLAAFVFRGPTKTTIGNNGLHNYGANIDYTFTKPKWNLELAGSYIYNIADSFGMQHNGNSGTNSFNGFASSDQTEILNPVAGLDARGTLGVGPFSLTAEYVAAASSFSTSTLSFGTQNNLQGAKPTAFHTEAAYKFNAWDKPSAFMIGYDQSKDALALLIPKKRYVATASTSIWKDTIESIEFRHDIDYNATDIAVGQGLNPITGTGKSGNTITLQVGLYF
ncbi:MAG: LbtU family siderophore porin [Pseudomonadota bacterium]